MPRLSNRTRDRVAERPDPRSWAPDELMGLEEAARLFWPHGPLTAKSLRTAVRDGRLAISVIAGKIFTCRAAVEEMGRCRCLDVAPARGPEPEAAQAAAPSARDAVMAVLERARADAARRGA